jgi:bifunctional DNA-binding transcriptional regulator/antitoxin component of YhaV-PrlF toxin-antitoxin module
MLIKVSKSKDGQDLHLPEEAAKRLGAKDGQEVAAFPISDGVVMIVRVDSNETRAKLKIADIINDALKKFKRQLADIGEEDKKKK